MDKAAALALPPAKDDSRDIFCKAGASSSAATLSLLPFLRLRLFAC
jgi:hypothetical protein